MVNRESCDEKKRQRDGVRREEEEEEEEEVEREVGFGGVGEVGGRELVKLRTPQL